MRKPFRGIQLNKSHPLARGLVGCWLMNEGDGSLIVDRCTSVEGVVGSTCNWKPGGLQFSAVYDDANSKVDCGSFLDPRSWKGCTVAVRASWPSVSAGQYPGIVCNVLPGNYRGNYSLYLSNNNNGITWYCPYTGVYPTLVPIVPDITYSIAGTWDEGKHITSLYCDGGLVDAKDTGGTTWYATNYNTTLGWYFRSVNRNFSGRLLYVYIYNRALTSDEVRQLHSDPYVIFEPSLPIGSMSPAVMAAVLQEYMQEFGHSYLNR